MKIPVFIAAAAGLILAVFLFVDPIAQDPAYHTFADRRLIAGIANFWNVTSNLAFLLAGGAGLAYLIFTDRDDLLARIEPALYPAYIVFFLGVTFTCFGSGWYHLSPANDSLVWDRLPMTIAFMAFFCIIIGEHLNPDIARRLLIPLLLVGAGSVFYWEYTEMQGAGDLRPYALVQFLPIMLIPIILIVFPARHGSNHIYWGMLAAYVASKVFEHFDQAIYETLVVISGHSIKHMAAAIAPALLVYGLSRRQAALHR